MFTIKFPQLTTVYIHAIRIKQGGKGVTITMRKNQQTNYLIYSSNPALPIGHLIFELLGLSLEFSK